MSDPWSRPTIKDLQEVLDSFECTDYDNQREAERLDLCVPAEITTSRGNVIAAMTREISRTGMGLLHRGAVSPSEVRVKMASETREFEYRMLIEWCQPCGNGMFISGGRFLGRATEEK